MLYKNVITMVLFVKDILMPVSMKPRRGALQNKIRFYPFLSTDYCQKLQNQYYYCKTMFCQVVFFLRYAFLSKQLWIEQKIQDSSFRVKHLCILMSHKD